MDKINWGIIGCGDVTEVKSGPAFNRIRQSELVAVMRRDSAKAADYAKRHHVPKWYDKASDLINDPAVNAIYIATPPSSHEEYTVAALQAGKPVYVEKPMSVNSISAARMAKLGNEPGKKLVVAHYRRAQPLFKKIRQLILDKAIGEIRFVRLETYKRSFTTTELSDPKKAWRVDTATAGGGIFHDLSPHQLDLMYHFFGEPAWISGIADNQSKQYEADDIVSGIIRFQSGVIGNGLWSFNVPPSGERERCEVMGEKGSIVFSFFEPAPVLVTIDGKTESLSFDPLPHVQEPMIAEVVKYFLDEGPNPCSGSEGVTVMSMIDQLSKHSVDW